MKKVILVLTILILFVSGCINNNGNNANIKADSIDDSTIKANEDAQKPSGNEVIDKSQYLTGEIITDGVYDYPSEGFGIIYFVPDEESSKIIKLKFNITSESIQLRYDDMEKVDKLPKELGIYKVKVSMELNENNKWLELKDIQLTDKIGTVLYEGKTYESNELDETVKVKDIVCGLIVKWIDRIYGGIQIRFAGEIESEGYYSINYDMMYDDNMGRIYFEDVYFNNIPFYGEKGFNNFYFAKTNDLFNRLESFSSFGRGIFKTSNYLLVYDIGMGRPVSDYLTEIISLDENYKNMFEFDKYKYVGVVDKSKDFIIVSLANYDEDSNYLSTDYYYINKNQPEKLFLFNSGSYNYYLKLVANENEFILATDGYNYMTGDNTQEHTIICKITAKRVITEKVEDLSIGSDKIEDNGQSFNMTGYISDIKINENKVIVTIKDVTMREQDTIAFGKMLNKDNLIDILIVDNNRSGPLIEVGDKIMASCRYTKDNEILYTIGADIRAYK